MSYFEYPDLDFDVKKYIYFQPKLVPSDQNLLKFGTFGI